MYSLLTFTSFFRHPVQRWRHFLAKELTHSRFADGATRIGATLFSELRNAVFANVGQKAVRYIARNTFEHLLNLNLKFHLTRQTGGLTRAIDRGTKWVGLLQGPTMTHKNTAGV